MMNLEDSMVTKEDIQKLNTNEKLLVMEYLWDDLAKSENQSDIIPDWHERVLNERREQYKKGNVTYKSLDSVKEELRDIT